MFSALSNAHSLVLSPFPSVSSSVQSCALSSNIAIKLSDALFCATLRFLFSSHSMVTSGVKNLKHLYSPRKTNIGLQWSLPVLGSRINYLKTKLHSASHPISFVFTILPFNDNFKYIQHCSVQLAISKAKFSIFIFHENIKHKISIPLSIKKLTFHLHRFIDR